MTRRIFTLMMVLSLLIALVGVVGSWAMDNAMGALSLRGEGIKRVFWKKVLTARLYAPADVASGAILHNHPKCLHVRYHLPVANGSDVVKELATLATEEDGVAVEPAVVARTAAAADRAATARAAGRVGCTRQAKDDVRQVLPEHGG